MRALLFLLCWLIPQVVAQPLTPEAIVLKADMPHLSLERQLSHFADPNNRLSFEQIQQQEFSLLPDFRSLGYNTKAHWFHFQLNLAADAPSRWVLTIGSPELEEVDVYVQQPDGSYRHYALGYHRPYENRPVRTRLFTLASEVFTGMNVYFRVRTTNAVLVYADLWQVNAFTTQDTSSNFYYGLYFGILLIAIALYVILGARLRDLTMTAYAGYMASQLLFHLGTTGYLPVLLNWQTAWFTDALPRVGWIGGAVSILLMWGHLLQLKQTYPYVQRFFRLTIFLHLALLPFALMPFLVGAWILPVVKLANGLSVLNFVISMGLLLWLWWRSRKAEWMIYFVAFVIPALGTLINNAVNQGFFRFNDFTSNFYQLAALAHVLVMSYGLALRLRQLQLDKTNAEHAVALAAQRAQEQRRFFAMISHEFGNPLAAIDRSAQMIELTGAPLAANVAPRLSNIRQNALALGNLINQFLSSEALANGSLRLDKHRCHLANILAEVMAAQEEKKRFVLHPYSSDLTLMADASMLKIALANLLSNALRYSPKDCMVEIRILKQGQKLRIDLLDFGPGLSPKELADIGQPWFRASSSQGKKGTGLGYYFAQQIITAHQGSLTAQTRAQGGLQVSIHLNLDDAS